MKKGERTAKTRSQNDGAGGMNISAEKYEGVWKAFLKPTVRGGDLV